MSEHKHTPGRMRAERSFDGWSIFDESGMSCIATVYDGVLPDPTGRANADLFAASPAMLDVLEQGYDGETFDTTLRSLSACTGKLYLTAKLRDWLSAKADDIDKVVRDATGGGA